MRLQYEKSKMAAGRGTKLFRTSLDQFSENVTSDGISWLFVVYNVFENAHSIL